MCGVVLAYLTYFHLRGWLCSELLLRVGDVVDAMSECFVFVLHLGPAVGVICDYVLECW